MTNPSKTTTKLIGSKGLLVIGGAVAISLAILTFSKWAATPNKNNPRFSYGTDNNNNEVVQVVDNNKTIVSFSFDIEPGVSEVSLALSGDHSQISGFEMTDRAVAVINGKAVSAVIIQFHDKPALKAGTHFLNVLAREKATGRIVGTGKIMFIYNMHEVVAKCSC